VQKMKKVMLTTGGTGGHIYPALAVADRLKIKGIDAVFVGSTERMEKDLVPESGHKFIGLDISVPRGFKNIRKYLKAIRAAFKVIKEEKPDAIIGFGNYISVPVIIAGILLRKNIYKFTILKCLGIRWIKIYEINFSMGIVI